MVLLRMWLPGLIPYFSMYPATFFWKSWKGHLTPRSSAAPPASLWWTHYSLLLWFPATTAALMRISRDFWGEVCAEGKVLWSCLSALVSCQIPTGFRVRRQEGTSLWRQTVLAPLGLEAALLKATWSPSCFRQPVLQLLTSLPAWTPLPSFWLTIPTFLPTY